MKRKQIKMNETMNAKWVVDSETGERLLIDFVSGEVICTEKEIQAYGG